MPYLLKYLRETGAIVGMWESTQLDLVAAQRVQEDAVYGYLLCAESPDVRPIEEHYHVRDATLVPRPPDAKE